MKNLPITPGLSVLPCDISVAEVIEVFDGRVDVIDSVQSKSDLLGALADILDFPRYWQSNWDSVEECLMDLSWLPPGPRVVVVADASRFADDDPDTFDIAIAVFARAARVHAQGRTPLHLYLLD